MRRVRRVAQPKKRDDKPAFKIKDIGVNSKKDTGDMTTTYSKTWRDINDKQLTRILDIAKKMEKGGWVVDSFFEVVDNPNEIRLKCSALGWSNRETVLLGPGRNTVTWTYRVIR